MTLIAWGKAKKSNPELVLRTLDELRGQLLTALGDDLVALIAYGDFVRPGEYDPLKSRVDLMLVLRSISTQVLDRAVDPVSIAQRKLKIGLMTLTEEDLVQSCDVFPVKFAEMQEHHRLLCGKDVLADLSVSDVHLRLRCEQELKNLMIRLRFIYLHGAKNKESLQVALEDTVGVLLRLLGVGLTLKSGISPEQTADILTAIEEEFRLDTTSLRTVLDMKHGTVTLSRDQVRCLFDDYMTVVHDAATIVDQLEVVA